jgi:multidrug resistance efflux pump
MHSSLDKAATAETLVPEPSPVLPRQVPGQDGPTSNLRLSLRLAVVIALLIGVVVLIGLYRQSGSRTSPGAALNQAANNTTLLRLKGTTAAIESQAIMAPALSGQQVATLTITKLTPAGARVKRGEILVEFDRQAQTRDFIDKRSEYQKLVSKVTEEQAKENNAHAHDETELRQAETELKRAQLDLQKSELLSQIDAEKAQQDLEQATAALKQLRETTILKRDAGRAGIRIFEIQRERTRRTMQYAETNADRMQIRAPLDGVVVLNAIFKAGRIGEVQEGDQVRPGTPFMQVINPSAMRVQAQVNQTDIPQLKVGQNVQVRLDAYPDLVLSGRLEQIAPIGRSGEFAPKVRTFSAVFSIQGHDPRLMPDLSAAVDVDTGSILSASDGSR